MNGKNLLLKQRWWVMSIKNNSDQISCRWLRSIKNFQHKHFSITWTKSSIEIFDVGTFKLFIQDEKNWSKGSSNRLVWVNATDSYCECRKRRNCITSKRKSMLFIWYLTVDRKCIKRNRIFSFYQIEIMLLQIKLVNCNN